MEEPPKSKPKDKAKVAPARPAGVGHEGDGEPKDMANVAPEHPAGVEGDKAEPLKASKAAKVFKNFAGRSPPGTPPWTWRFDAVKAAWYESLGPTIESINWGLPFHHAFLAFCLIHSQEVQGPDKEGPARQVPGLTGLLFRVLFFLQRLHVRVASFHCCKEEWWLFCCENIDLTDLDSEGECIEKVRQLAEEYSLPASVLA